MHAISWFPLGPYGGDARTFAVDPADSQHMYLGTATGWVYESHDGGRGWSRLAQIAKRDDLVIKQIIADPRDPLHLIVGAYIPSSPLGGLFMSQDGGKSWYEQAEMHGQSVRSLTRSASNPDVLVAGTLTGVFRSRDNGAHWKAISPEGSTEIHEVESVAIDPVDPQVIYAGTWHLPWKTVDGGEHWKNIKQGIIDDSDVFSILVDPKQPKVVYASACSGIYKSTDAAVEFRKIQGIPTTARRTRKLAQDPEHLETVYAGTTEGLYRTLDAGEHWDRMTGPDVIVNDVYIDPKNSSHVLLATDRGGVLSSEDMASTFVATNNGFSSRQVTSYIADPRHTAVVYVGVVNDKETGGVFQSRDGGVRWGQMSDGLGGRDVFSLATTEDGTLLAGTGHGVFRWQDGLWQDSSEMVAVVKATPPPVAPTAAPKSALKTGSKAASKRPAKVAVRPKPAAIAPEPTPQRMDVAVYALQQQGSAVFAGTSLGLMRADAEGKTWQPVASLTMPEVRFLTVQSAQSSMVVAAGLKHLALSVNGGVSWRTIMMPHGLTQITTVALDDTRRIWVGGGEGVFVTADAGTTWTRPQDLVVNGVNGMYFDSKEERMLVTSFQSNYVYAIHVPDGKITYLDTGWKLRFARPVGDHLIGATLFDGIVVQPVMVADSK